MCEIYKYRTMSFTYNMGKSVKDYVECCGGISFDINHIICTHGQLNIPAQLSLYSLPVCELLARLNLSGSLDNYHIQLGGGFFKMKGSNELESFSLERNIVTNVFLMEL